MQKIKTAGLPYKGGKNKLAERIVSIFPRAEHFYDLFSGGCAIAHCALLKNKFPHVHINDINPMMPQAFVKALQGGFDDEDRWISREDFMRLKDTDPYVAICFSFGNDLKTYCYGKDIEETKKALHYAIFFSSYELSDRLIGVDLRPIEKCATRQEKYALAKKLIKEAYSRNTPPPTTMLESYQRLRRIQTLQLREAGANNVAFPSKKTRHGSNCRAWSASTDCIQDRFDRKSAHSAAVNGNTQQTSNNYPPPLSRVELENQERLLRLTSISDPKKACCLTWSIGDYQDVEIEDNSVIYTDIPYLSGGKMTNEYVNGGDNFDHERFYDWCLKQTQPLYISSYEMPEKDFKVVAEFARIDTMSATNNGKLVSEKLFMPRTQETKGNIQLSLF